MFKIIQEFEGFEEPKHMKAKRLLDFSSFAAESKV